MAIRATLLGTRVQGLLLLGAAAAMISATAVPLEAQQIEVRPIAKFSLPTKFSLQDGTLRVSQRVGFSVWRPDERQAQRALGCDERCHL